MTDPNETPQHPGAIITAADVIAEKAASEVDGSEPNITPTHLGNPVAARDAPSGPDAPVFTAQPVATQTASSTGSPTWRPGDTPEVHQHHDSMTDGAREPTDEPPL